MISAQSTGRQGVCLSRWGAASGLRLCLHNNPGREGCRSPNPSVSSEDTWRARTPRGQVHGPTGDLCRSRAGVTQG